MSDLFVYDLETQERQLILTAQGAFEWFGYSPDLSTYWYHIVDFCNTRLVSNDGKQIAVLGSSDKILGWIDKDKFLLETTYVNPPDCYPTTGIAIANRYGLTGDWVTPTRFEYASLTPDGTKLVYDSECNNKGCKKLLIANTDGSNPQTLLESPDPVINAYGISFSPDGKHLLCRTDCDEWVCKKVIALDMDSKETRIIYESEDYEWFTFSWLQD